MSKTKWVHATLNSYNMQFQKHLFIKIMIYYYIHETAESEIPPTNPTHMSHIAVRGNTIMYACVSSSINVVSGSASLYGLKRLAFNIIN